MAAKLKEEAHSGNLKSSGLFWSATRQHGFWIKEHDVNPVLILISGTAWSPEMQMTLKNLEVLYLLGSWDLDFATLAGV